MRADPTGPVLHFNLYLLWANCEPNESRGWNHLTQVNQWKGSGRSQRGSPRWGGVGKPWGRWVHRGGNCLYLLWVHCIINFTATMETGPNGANLVSPKNCDSISGWLARTMTFLHCQKEAESPQFRIFRLRWQHFPTLYNFGSSSLFQISHFWPWRSCHKNMSYIFWLGPNALYIS